jgi:uncharacterized protein
LIAAVFAARAAGMVHVPANCKSPFGPVAKAICADPRSHKLDIALFHLVRKVEARLARFKAIRSALETDLALRHEAWEGRRALCLKARRPHSCLRKRYNERIIELNRYYRFGPPGN